MIEPTVVILLSDKRSGSTMVQDELCRHAHVQRVEYSPHTFFETHHWLKAACVLGMPDQQFAGGQRYRGYGSRSSARRYLIDCVRGNVPGFAIPENDEALVFEGWEALCERFAKPVFFEKSPQNIHHRAALDLLLRWVKTTRYSVRIIGLVRNPMAVMASAQKAFSTPPAERQMGWADGCRNLLLVRERLGWEHMRIVRYEDLVERPESEFTELCQFIGIEPEGSIGASVHKSSTRKWVQDPGFDLQLDPSVAAVSELFGYDEEAVENPLAGKPVWSKAKTMTIRDRVRLATSRLFQRYLKPLALRTWQKK